MNIYVLNLLSFSRHFKVIYNRGINKWVLRIRVAAWLSTLTPFSKYLKYINIAIISVHSLASVFYFIWFADITFILTLPHTETHTHLSTHTHTLLVSLAMFVTYNIPFISAIFGDWHGFLKTNAVYSCDKCSGWLSQFIFEIKLCKWHWLCNRDQTDSLPQLLKMCGHTAKHNYQH